MKILIIGSDFRWYNESYVRAFKTFSDEVRLSNCTFSIPKSNFLIRLKRLMGLSIDQYSEIVQKKRDKQFISDFDDFKPDLVFVRTGNQMSESVLSYFKGKAIIFLYLSDSLSRYNQLIPLLKYYDKIYTFETTDIPIVEKLGIKCETMFGSYDPEQYYLISKETERDIDVFFVGKMYPDRLQLLKKLTMDLSDKNLKFYGRFIPNYKLFSRIRFRLSRYYNYFVNEDLHYSDVNLFYNRSKIVLNLHHKQTTNGWNSRTAEIMAAGAFEIVDNNPAIIDTFGECVGLFQNYEELRECVEFYLQNNKIREQKAENGMQLVNDYHSIYSDAERMVRDAEQLIRESRCHKQ